MVRLVDAGRLVVDPRSLSVGGSLVVRVGNDGPGTAAGAFLVTAFEDRDADGRFEPGVDAVLGEQTVTGLEAGGSANVELAVGGSVSFAGNLVYALVDSTFAVAEADEANNYGSSSPGCGAPASSEDWRVTLEWSWTKTDVDPVSTLVVNAPIVLDVDGDAVPDVLFVAHGTRRDSIGYAYGGRLRALERPGRPRAVERDRPRAGPDRRRSPGRGRHRRRRPPRDPRGGLGRDEPARLRARRDVEVDERHHSRTRGGEARPSRTSTATAVPEILIGRQVLTHEGRLLWTGAFAGQGGDRGAHSFAVDLDLDGQPEVLVGNTAYRGQGRAAGQVLWQQHEHRRRRPRSATATRRWGTSTRTPTRRSSSCPGAGSSSSSTTER